MGDADVDHPAHQDALDLRMTVKDASPPHRRESEFREAVRRNTSFSSRLSGGGSPDSDRMPPDSQTQPLTPNGAYSADSAKFASRSPTSTVTSEGGSPVEHKVKDFSEALESGKNGAPHAPLRPFKMYPHMDSLMYGSMLGGAMGSAMGAHGGMGSMGLPSMYDTPPSSTSPSSTAFGLGMTPMVSYVMQKRRRFEAREREISGGSSSGKDKDPSASRSPPATATSSSPTADFDLDEPDDKKLKMMPDEKKDEAYWERRRKNNEAAKRSRDARRQKEEEIAMRAAFLEQENLKLRAQVAILKNETAKLHYLLYNRV
ncbi:hypothetical protein V1264_018574 [Littorina saxatilis]